MVDGRDTNSGIRTIPALSIKDGDPVVAQKRRTYEPLEDEDGNTITPREFVEQLVNRRGRLVYIMDVNGIEHNKPQYSLIKDISKVADLWVDAGSRTVESLMDILVAGADRAVLSTKAMGGLSDIDEVMEIMDEALLCIDYDRKVLARSKELASMTPAVIAGIAHGKGVREVVFADYGRKRKGPLKLDIIKDLVRTGAGVYVGGRIRTDDIRALEGIGARGVLLEMMGIIKKW